MSGISEDVVGQYNWHDFYQRGDGTRGWHGGTADPNGFDALLGNGQRSWLEDIVLLDPDTVVYAMPAFVKSQLNAGANNRLQALP